jgi:uncharacterized membrane protein YvbJ
MPGSGFVQCKNCSSDLTETAEFCPACGKKVRGRHGFWDEKEIPQKESEKKKSLLERFSTPILVIFAL